ncbi:type II toxin-antitoxin system death-on-curing family toxin [Pontibacter beigongshangensis]|uniref:type II toxin-antitoxin system death-on-curing family toxin n=1 Tax=Pontibacter beigongshangensis TaxID=2574733 RepID=UPI00164FA86B|nr:type II toxin-antitoxin system death-on-curing family toxin [Pontibacter beigongshangensis]
MITVKEVELIHNLLIDEFGGAKGIRDFGALDAALKRPYATFDTVELYPTPIEKAAAIIESILLNHPFVDGNKRTGYVLMRLILLQANQDIVAHQDEKYDFVIAIAKGELSTESITEWIRARVE